MVNGKSKPIRKGGFKTKREAQATVTEIESKMNKGYSLITQKVPFNEYFEAWIKTYKTDIKETTRKLNTHIRSCVLNAIDEGIIHVNFTRGAVVTGKQGKSNDEKYLNYDKSQKLLNAILEKEKKALTDYLIILALASVLLYQGVSFYYVSKRLGHKDIETTLNTYSHVIKEMEERDENMSTETFQRMYV
jgi:site-specific recombinase XerD